MRTSLSHEPLGPRQSHWEVIIPMGILQAPHIHHINPTLSLFPPQTHSFPRLHISGWSHQPQSPARPQALSLPRPSFSVHQAPAPSLLLLSSPSPPHYPSSDLVFFSGSLPQPPPWDSNSDSLTPESMLTKELGAGRWGEKGLEVGGGGAGAEPE